MYLPLCKVADTPFRIQGDGMLLPGQRELNHSFARMEKHYVFAHGDELCIIWAYVTGEHWRNNIQLFRPLSIPNNLFKCSFHL